MKNKLFLVSITIISTLFGQCCKVKECNEYLVDDVSEYLSKYFDVYKLHQSVLFQSKNKIDTIEIINIKVDTSYIKDSRTCAIPSSKKIIFKSRHFYQGNHIAYKLRSTNFMSCYVIDTTLSTKIFTLFQVDYAISDKQFKNSNTIVNNKVELLDSFNHQNNLYKNVLKLETANSDLTKILFYFAPEKGLIRWETSSDTFNIKN